MPVKAEMLRIQKLANRKGELRVRRYDPITGEKMLVNPSKHDPDDLSTVADWEHEAYPLLGVKLVGEAPKLTTLSTGKVDEGIREGWIELVKEKLVHRPGGPAEDPNRTDKIHSFRHADEIVLKCLDGDVAYKVVQQPDKFVADVDSETGAKTLSDPDAKVTDEHYADGATVVENFYVLEKI